MKMLAVASLTLGLLTYPALAWDVGVPDITNDYAGPVCYSFHLRNNPETYVINYKDEGAQVKIDIIRNRGNRNLPVTLSTWEDVNPVFQQIFAPMTACMDAVGALSLHERIIKVY